ncbi:MAG: methionyl-tRNA formyltransferase [Gammaproteobacteria bacterium]|nr:methionyl-tRNA formyltransferase [Gammaproteobacteria bacterium]
MRIGFAGTPAFAATALQALLDAGSNPTVVYTQPDRPSGRGRKLQASAVKQLAIAAGLPVRQPVSLRDESAQAALAAEQLDLLIVVAYGLLLPKAVLEMPRLGCVNLHGSLLPRWRGAAPIQRAIQSGDEYTGVDLMQMDEGLDTGPILARVTTPIGAHTASSLTEHLATLGGSLLAESLPKLLAGELTARAQPEEGTTYAAKLSKAEGWLDWSQNSATLLRQIKAFNPYPGCFAELGADTIKIWDAEAGSATAASAGEIVEVSKAGVEVATADGTIRLLEIQKPGAKRMQVADIWHGLSWKGMTFAASSTVE